MLPRRRRALAFGEALFHCVIASQYKNRPPDGSYTGVAIRIPFAERRERIATSLRSSQ